MTILTAAGSFGKTYKHKFGATIVSIRELEEAVFVGKLKEAETIVHNAATITTEDIETALTNNFDFSRYLIKKLQLVNPEVQFVFISSMSILDTEDGSKYADVMNMSPYSYSKYLAEIYALKCPLKHVSCVRFSTLFYEDPSKDGLSKLVYDAVNNKKITIYNNGEAKRNFLPIGVAAAYIKSLTEYGRSVSIGKKVYNFAALENYSFKEIARLLQKHVPGLVVENKHMQETNKVLIDFNNTGPLAVGAIPFSLEDSIVSYINRLRS